MTDSAPQTDLDKALYLADEADKITKRHFMSAHLRVDTKPDKTPVTQADLETEQRLSQIIHEEFGDNFIGEEGTRDPAKGRRWVVDPIDGTKNFMRGMPVWATLIALTDDNGPLTAVATAPALGRRWWASKGGGAWTQDVDGNVRQLHVSRVNELRNGFLLHSSLYSWDKVSVGLEPVMQLIKDMWRSRAVGDFWGHLLVAEGAADACIEPNLKQWDMEALRLIITEAGGSIWTNAAPDAKPEAERIVITTNGLLEKLLLDRLKP